MHEAGQHLTGMLPAQMVQNLEGFVGEVEHVPGVHVDVICDGGENHIRYRLLRNAKLYRSSQASLSPVRVAHIYEVAEP